MTDAWRLADPPPEQRVFGPYLRKFLKAIRKASGKPAARISCVLLLLISESGLAQSFEINQGLSGGWYEPATTGQGLYLEIYPPRNLVHLGWFSYLPANEITEPDSPASQRWYTALGEYEGATATLAVYETTGGRFDMPQPSETIEVGEIRLVFESCNEASMAYEIPGEGLQGEFELIRLASSALCEQLSADSGTNP